MTPSLFVLLEQALLPGETVKFTIGRQADGLMLLLQPLRPKSADVPKEAEAARAALALPLRLAGPAADLDAAFEAKLQGYAQARHVLSDAYETLVAALNEAAKVAQATKSKTVSRTAKSTVSKPATGTSSAATPAASAETSTPSAEAPAAPAPQTMSLFQERPTA